RADAGAAEGGLRGRGHADARRCAPARARSLHAGRPAPLARRLCALDVRAAPAPAEGPRRPRAGPPMSQSPPSGLQLAYRGLRLLPDVLRSGPTGHFTAGDLLERAAARRGDAPVVCHEGRVMSYAELNAQANRGAPWAMARGVAQGWVVGLLMENRPEYLATWLGLAKVGAVSALLNTNLRGPALAHSLRTAGCDHALIGTACVDAWSALEADAPKIEIFWVRDHDGKASALPSVASSLDDEVAGSSAENPPRHVRPVPL